MMVKVFILDEHPVMRQGLASILETCADCQVVGDATSVQDALPKIYELKPDIVIMDAFRDNTDNSEDITTIQEMCEKVKIFILTGSSRENDFIKAMGAGVKGYFSKNSEVAQLLDAIQLVATDAVVYSSKMARLFDSTLHETSRLDQLSQREKEILNFVARGHSNKDIANLCFVSEATVKSHMRRIMEKLDVKNRAEAVTTAIEKGLLTINRN